MFKPTEPEIPEDPSIRGNYIVIFKKANGTPEYGNVRKVQVNDVVEYFDGGCRSSEVASVIGRGEKMRIRTRPMEFQGMVLRRGVTLHLNELKSVLRVRPDIAVRMDPNTLHREFVSQEPLPPPPPPPPLPEVKFAPMVRPPSKEPKIEPLIPLKEAPKIVKAVKRQASTAIPPMEVPKFASVSRPPVKESKSRKTEMVIKNRPPVPRLQIRAATSEGEEGFNVVGHIGIQEIRIFVRLRQTAEKIIAIYKVGGSPHDISALVNNESKPKISTPPKVVKSIPRKTPPVPAKKPEPPPAEPIRRKARGAKMDRMGATA